MTCGLLDYISVAIISPLGVPAILILVNQWNMKRPRHYVLLVALLGAVLLVFQAGIYAVWGPTAPGRALAGLLSPLLCWGFFVFATPFRDGRLLFTLVTGLLLCSTDELLVNTFTQRGTAADIAVRIALCAVQSAALLLFCRKPFHRMLTAVGVNWVLLSALPLLLFLCQLVLYIIPTNFLFIRPDLPGALVTCVSAVFIYVILYKLITAMQRQQAADQGYALLQSQIRLLEGQTRQVLAKDDENRTFRHDMRHFINLMQGCAAARDWDALQAVLRHMSEDVDGLSARCRLRQYTGNTIIDAVLTLAAEQCEEEGIAFAAQLTVPENLRVDTAELAVVVSNALENAHNACAAMGPDGGPRQVRITSACQGRQYLLSICNTCSGAVRFDSDTGLPLSQRRGHGFGTQSIAAFAQKYGALLHYSQEDGWFSLAILI